VSHIPRILITSGEPAGIGPDLCLAISQQSWARDGSICEVVFAGDRDVFAQRAAQLSQQLQLAPNQSLLHFPTAAPVLPGKLDVRNAHYVLSLLDAAAQGCLRGEFDAIVTAPIQKSVINDAGLPFTGHTEYFADKTQTPLPVMMLVADQLRVALVTTHLPLSKVSQAITGELLAKIIVILDHDLRIRFGIDQPRIMVCGLNPHAGENGYLGREEIEVITPTLNALRECKINVIGPVPADTAFTPKQLSQADCVLAMYHDQGLPALKYAGFGHAVNVTLGLPIIRTSVDHGTALDLAGTGRADAGSLQAALKLAIQLAGR
jgi:4-hydroxythreonine-4-phosphate dehydrogenase